MLEELGIFNQKMIRSPGFFIMRIKGYRLKALSNLRKPSII
jgi:hypothetical protein